MQADKDLCDVMATPHGKRMVWRILDHCGPMRSTFDKHSDRVSAYLEGQRSIAVWLIAELGAADPDAFADLIRYMQQPVAKSATDDAEDDGAA